MNRPRVLNALNRAMYREIDAAISELEEDDSIAVIVITGAGERAFSAGADIHEMARIAEETGSQDGDPDRARHMWHLGDVLASRPSGPSTGWRTAGALWSRRAWISGSGRNLRASGSWRRRTGG